MHKTNPASLHLGIAERGKMHALAGDYPEALRHYREALRMAQEQSDTNVFFQHYTQCVMESLERSGAHTEVISYCEKVNQHFEEHPADTTLGRRQHAAVLERWAVQLIRQGEGTDSRQLLEEAQKLTGRGVHPLTDALLNWVQRGFAISTQQLEQVQTRHHYFVVRQDQINEQIAIDLPKVAGPLI
ncbi:MAG: peptidylprolyl isomerase [Bacteroidota bacterium]